MNPLFRKARNLYSRLRITKLTVMENQKNKPPKGVVIAILALAAMIIIYLILTTVFPELFQAINVGEQVPIKNN